MTLSIRYEMPEPSLYWDDDGWGGCDCEDYQENDCGCEGCDSCDSDNPCDCEGYQECTCEGCDTSDGSDGNCSCDGWCDFFAFAGDCGSCDGGGYDPDNEDCACNGTCNGEDCLCDGASKDEGECPCYSSCNEENCSVGNAIQCDMCDNSENDVRCGVYCVTASDTTDCSYCYAVSDGGCARTNNCTTGDVTCDCNSGCHQQGSSAVIGPVGCAYGYEVNSGCGSEDEDCSCYSITYSPCSCDASCNTACDSDVCAVCHGTCYGYQDCSCNATCFGQPIACTCNGGCYTQPIACSCDNRCNAYTSCATCNTCNGYIKCSCDLACYSESCDQCHSMQYSAVPI